MQHEINIEYDFLIRKKTRRNIVVMYKLKTTIRQILFGLFDIGAICYLSRFLRALQRFSAFFIILPLS